MPWQKVSFGQVLVKFCRIELADILGQFPDPYLLFQTSLQLGAKKSQHTFLRSHQQLLIDASVHERSGLFRDLPRKAALKFVLMPVAVIVITMRRPSASCTAPAGFGITP